MVGAEMFEKRRRGFSRQKDLHTQVPAMSFEGCLVSSRHTPLWLWRGVHLVCNSSSVL